jgi:uncharacterized delta-60 repeat protein
MAAHSPRGPQGQADMDRRGASRSTWLAALLLLTQACGGGAGRPSGVVVQPAIHPFVGQAWHYELSYTGSTDPFRTEVVVLPTEASFDRPLQDFYDADPVVIWPEREYPVAYGEVYATRDGATYWAAAAAPSGDVTQPHQHIGLLTDFQQTKVYRKTAASGARLQLVMTVADLETIDSNPDQPAHAECPWYVVADGPGQSCADSIHASLTFRLDAWKLLPNGGYVTLRDLEWTAELHGWRDHWRFRAASSALSDVATVTQSSFDFYPDFDDYQGVHALAQLAAPVTLEVPLDLVAQDEQFTVQVQVVASTYNRRQRESWVGARFRDPQKLTGLQELSQGVEPVTVDLPQPLPRPPPPAPAPAPACATGVDPAAGTIQFEAATYDAFERPGSVALVAVTRTGGGKGQVSAIATTRDGTAHAGLDYTTTRSLVRFADGEEGTRLVVVPVVDNDVADGTRTILVDLSSPAHCASLGAITTSTIALRDDDGRPPPPSTYAVGGTVSGLAGSGLLLRELFSGDTLSPAAGGAFAFATGHLTNSFYEVRIDAQPSNPAQRCSVANGAGTVGNADVTDVLVTCVTLAGNGALDATFGTGGKLASPIAGAPVSLARQADGKLLLVGGLQLARFTADGAPDPTFGTAGKVTVAFNGGGFDAAQGLAVQGDGRIVVAGFTSVAGQDDFALVRYLADGTVDTTFGNSGKVTTDFAGSTDQARRVVVQGDGMLVAAGLSVAGAGASADADFAVARYTADGSLDAGFGSGGRVRINVAGKFDAVQGLALQADGRIVLAGRVGADGGSDPDFGLVRLNADGTLDASFGTGGVVRTDFGLGGWEEAADVAVQGDGRVVACGRVRVAGAFQFAVARFDATGQPDAGFGTAGLATAAFGTQGDVAKGLALQADGAIVVAGQAASLGSNPDFGLVRWLPDGTLDTGFGAGGKVAVDFFGAIDGAVGVVLQDGGQIVAGGAVRNGSSTVFGLARLLP